MQPECNTYIHNQMDQKIISAPLMNSILIDELHGKPASKVHLCTWHQLFHLGMRWQQTLVARGVYDHKKELVTRLSRHSDETGLDTRKRAAGQC